MWVNKSHKVPGHTLSELLVVMVITVLVVGIAFSVLRLVMYQFQKIELAYTNQTELGKFKQQLYLDIDRAHTLFWDADEAILRLEGKPKSLSYKLEDAFILRDEDTIPIQMSNQIGYNNGKEVSSGFLDALKITLEVNRQSVSIFVTKPRDAKQQIMQEWD